MKDQRNSDSRVTRKFDALRADGRKAFVAFLTAGDPNYDTSLELVTGLPAAGADIIELGMPFSDPMADGPSVQASSQRALKAGMTLVKTLELVRRFRETDNDTPIILMGYYNPIYTYGAEKFVHDAVANGADGLIIVDLPPEEDAELCDPALIAGLHWIRLVTPTTDDQRIGAVLHNMSGFIYYISILGITGTRSAAIDHVEYAVERLRGYTDLPIAVGFGIKTPEQANAIATVADGIVVGSALVDIVKENVDENGEPNSGLTNRLHALVGELSQAIRNT